MAQPHGQAAAKASLEWTWDRNALAVWEFLKRAESEEELVPPS